MEITNIIDWDCGCGATRVGDNWDIEFCIDHQPRGVQE
tara:strand:+ start:342 stop:455 length:114 start_codon:yes stop_codon:yes gene_type:complete